MNENKSSGVPFSELLKNETILEAISKLGFTSATPVQELTLPLALEKKDLLIQAKTGSGKTYAFGIPMAVRIVEELADDNKRNNFSLVLAPTRELAAQIADAVKLLVSDLEPVLLIGGMPAGAQKTAMKNDPRVVVGTPGRILDFIRQGILSLGDCKFFVLDEVDEMFSMGFIEDVKDIIAEIPPAAQGLFASATVPYQVKALCKQFLQDPVELNASTIDEAPALITHQFCNVGPGMSDKPQALTDLIEFLQPNSAIIFCNTRSETEVVEVFLRRRGFDARRLNSDLNQRQRIKVMDMIRNQELRFLIATDIAARGIDISNIELVVNQSIHPQSENYVHRTGRTGRAGKEGKAISLVSPHDFMAFRTVQQELDLEFEEIKLPTEDELAKARLTFLEKTLREKAGTPLDSDIKLAKLLLESKGSLSDPSDELVKLTATLAKFVAEHVVEQNTKSLDQELAEQQERRKEKQPRSSNKGKKGGGRRRSQGNRKGGRNNKR